MIRDLFGATTFMSGDPEQPQPRLQLGDFWSDADKNADSTGLPVTSAWKAPGAHPDRPLCSRCAGELVRSRIRAYERFLTLFTNARPYRCLDCRSRRWR